MRLLYLQRFTIRINSLVSYHFIFITWTLIGLQNPYGYGNSHICIRIQEVKLVEKCTTILGTRPSIIFGDLNII